MVVPGDDRQRAVRGRERAAGRLRVAGLPGGAVPVAGGDVLAPPDAAIGPAGRVAGRHRGGRRRLRRYGPDPAGNSARDGPPAASTRKCRCGLLESSRTCVRGRSAIVATRTGLSPAELERIRDTLAAGRKPKVVFTEAAGQMAGQVGQVIQLTDPQLSDEWLVVRFGR